MESSYTQDPCRAVEPEGLCSEIEGVLRRFLADPMDHETRVALHSLERLGFDRGPIEFKRPALILARVCLGSIEQTWGTAPERAVTEDTVRIAEWAVRVLTGADGLTYRQEFRALDDRGAGPVRRIKPAWPEWYRRFLASMGEIADSRAVEAEHVAQIGEAMLAMDPQTVGGYLTWRIVSELARPIMFGRYVSDESKWRDEVVHGLTEKWSADGVQWDMLDHELMRACRKQGFAVDYLLRGPRQIVWRMDDLLGRTELA